MPHLRRDWGSPSYTRLQVRRGAHKTLRGAQGTSAPHRALLHRHAACPGIHPSGGAYQVRASELTDEDILGRNDDEAAMSCRDLWDPTILG